MISSDKLWKDYYFNLLSFIRKRVTTNEIAEDILQDVFLKVHTRLNTLADTERIESWLYQITRNTIIDYHRVHKRFEPLLSDVLVDKHSNERVWRKLEPCLKTMIWNLPESYRDAVHLSEIQEVPLKEVAIHQSISLSGAKSRVQRGRKRLKEMFLECCDFEFNRMGELVDFTPKDNSSHKLCK